jgi:uncharacterized membrane protein YvlD (DUF360 family)
MLLYEHERTKSIAARLIQASRVARLITTGFFMLVIAAIFTTAAAFLTPGYAWLGGILGLVVGYGIGVYAGALLSIGMEWMAQMAVAQGEIVEELRKRA